VAAVCSGNCRRPRQPPPTDHLSIYSFYSIAQLSQREQRDSYRLPSCLYWLAHTAGLDVMDKDIRGASAFGYHLGQPPSQPENNQQAFSHPRESSRRSSDQQSPKEAAQEVSAKRKAVVKSACDRCKGGKVKCDGRRVRGGGGIRIVVALTRCSTFGPILLFCPQPCNRCTSLSKGGLGWYVMPFGKPKKKTTIELTDIFLCEQL
jgi:hypothetical protein